MIKDIFSHLSQFSSGIFEANHTDMKYKKLGNTGVDVSVICLGTMTYGMQNSEQEAHEQLDYAISQGVNFIDTAELYAVPASKETQGLTEEYIGSWIAKRGRRDDFILATKVTGPSPNLKYISPNLGFTKPRIKEALELSLKRLKTDYIDLYQFHWPERKTNYFGQLGYKHDPSSEEIDNFLESLETIDQLVKEGKIRYLGISNETPWGLFKYLTTSKEYNLPKVQSVQNPYSLLNRSYEVGMAEMSIREQVGLLAYSPLAFGLLSGKYHNGTAKPTDRINKFKSMSRFNGEITHKAAGEYLKVANDHGLDMAQMALSFINSRDFLTSNIIGATTMEQLRLNIASAYVHLSEEVIKDIENVHKQYSNPAP